MLDKEKRKEAAELIKGIPKDFKKLSEDAFKAKKLYGKLDKVCDKKKIDTDEYMSILKKIRKIVKGMESEEAYQLVATTLTDAHLILNYEQFLEEDSLQKEGKEIARKGILYMKNVKKCANLFEQMMCNIIKENENILGMNDVSIME